jgi:uncharacterized membrane protein
MLKSRFVPVLVLLLMLSSGLPVVEFETLAEESVSKEVPANLQNYNLYLDKEGDSGGDGAITTTEPDGSPEEASVLSGVEFRSDDLISDITIYGEGSASEVNLYIYLKFKGQEGSTADLTYTLNSVGGPTYTVTDELTSPCQDSILPGSTGCTWTINEIAFDVPEDGFTVEKGARLHLQIDGSCDSQGGTGGSPPSGGGDCDVEVAFGNLDNTNSFSRLTMKANALADSSVRVHPTGGIWTDDEQLEWSPNHRPEFRTIQFSVDIRDAFGRDDIHSIDLVLTKPSGANTEFDKEFEDDDLRLDNNGLVGNYTWIYDAGIEPGEYALQLEITDVQGHTIVYSHQGLEFLEYGMYLSLPAGQTDSVLIAPGQRSTVEFMVEHTGSAGVEMEVEFELFTSLPPTWSEPNWDSPGGISLNGGGSFKIETLSIEVPESDLSDKPPRIEVWARGFVENEDNIREEVVIEKIVLDVEEVGVFAPPRLNVYEDEEHQIQIADSNRPEAFDVTLSHYIDYEMWETGEPFYIDLFNAGFDTDTYRLKVEDLPSSSWLYKFYDNDTGEELDPEGVYAVTPSIGSHEMFSIMMKIYPPTERDDVDIGLFSINCFSAGNSSLSSMSSFTVHRTFGILAEVISDSDGQEIGSVGPVSPGSEVTFNVRITDSTDNASQQNTWRVISPGNLKMNTDVEPSYGAWDYSMKDDNGSEVVAIRLMPGNYGDVEVTIGMRDQVRADNHTLYLRVTEEVSDGDFVRYFDLPLKIIVEKEILPGRVFVERVTEITPFLAGMEQNIEFSVENSNNVMLDIIISAQSIPEGWTASFSTSGSTQQGNTVLLKIDAFGTSEFTLVLRASDDVAAGNDAEVVLSVEPVDDELSTMQQEVKFMFATDCEGADCFISAALDFENPQTIGLYLGITLILFLAIYRRGQTSARDTIIFEEEETSFEEMNNKFDDIPEAITSDEDLDDDLELLDDLDDLE